MIVRSSLILLIATIPACLAQVPSKAAQVAKPLAAKAPAKGSMARPKPGILSGRIFLITKGGDIKPARMAKLYLLWLSNGIADELEDPAYLVFARTRLKTMDQFLEEYEASNWSEPRACRKELSTYNKALLETLEWGAGPSKTNQFQFDDADEDGNFKITVARPGLYHLLAIGRAGFSDAVWESDLIEVNPGVETTVKLPAPKKACLVVE